MKDARALSIRQPWVELILKGRKRIELRSWRTSYRGLLWLHAGAKADAELIEQFGEPVYLGGYVGTAELVSVVPIDEARWDAWQSLHLSGRYEAGYFAWLLSDPLRFDEPIPAKGRLGLFRPDEEMEATLIKALSAQRSRPDG